MNTKLEKKLYKKYPKIFAQKDMSPKETLICFGCECSDGWYRIIDALCGVIQNHVDNCHIYVPKSWFHKKIDRFFLWLHNTTYTYTSERADWIWRFTYGLRGMICSWSQKETRPKQVEAVQIKEKFAGLRFYTDGHDDFVDGAIEMATSMSYRTCELCGAEGSHYIRGSWHCTFCPDCAKEEGAKKAIKKGK